MSIQYSLVIFTLLTGMAGWMFACVAIDEFAKKTKKTNFLAALIALILLAAGGFASVTHLSHPDRILGALAHPTSGIFVEAVLVGVIALCIILYLFTVKRESAARKIFAVVGGLLGIALSYMAGSSYIMSSIAAWDTVLLPVAYCASVIPAGIGAYIFIAALRKEEDLGLYGILLFVGGLLAAAASAAFLLKAGADLGLTLGVAVVVGGILPAICGLLIAKKKAPALFALIAVLGALAGAFALRGLMWTVGKSLYNLFGTII